MPSVTKSLNPGSSLLQPADSNDVQKVIARLGVTYGLPAVNETQAKAIANVLIAEGWTVGEIDNAASAIGGDPELGRQISFDQTITPTLFALARKHYRVMRGRLHSYEEAKQMASDRARPLHEIAEAVRVEVPGEDGGEPYQITRWRLK